MPPKLSNSCFPTNSLHSYWELTYPVTSKGSTQKFTKGDIILVDLLHNIFKGNLILSLLSYTVTIIIKCF